MSGAEILHPARRRPPPRAGQRSRLRALRPLLAGFLVPLILVLEAAAWGRYVPSFDQFLSTNLRMLEHLGPQLLGLALVLSLHVIAGTAVGAEILVLGLTRYTFVAATFVWPWLAADLPDLARLRVLLTDIRRDLLVATAPQG